MKKTLRFWHAYKSLIISIVLAVVVAVASYFIIYSRQIQRQLVESQNLQASTTADYSTLITEQREAINDIKSKNAKLSGLLTAEQIKRLELEKIKEDKEKQIDTLTKLTTIDPELIKKYSKVYFLSENYIPAALKDVEDKYLIDRTKETQILENTYVFFKKMMDDAEKEGVSIMVTSAYRSFEYQKNLKSDYRVIYGAGTANQFSADQGYSEHQLGTAIDFVTSKVRGADIEFEETPAFEWLNNNAYKYGFILSYPKSNKYYEYEPWHWRFVGRELAKTLHDSGKYFYEMDQREIDAHLIKLFD